MRCDVVLSDAVVLGMSRVMQLRMFAQFRTAVSKVLSTLA
jgi:hypothetical protein